MGEEGHTAGQVKIGISKREDKLCVGKNQLGGYELRVVDEECPEDDRTSTDSDVIGGGIGNEPRRVELDRPSSSAFTARLGLEMLTTISALLFVGVVSVDPMPLPATVAGFRSVDEEPLDKGRPPEKEEGRGGKEMACWSAKGSISSKISFESKVLNGSLVDVSEGTELVLQLSLSVPVTIDAAGASYPSS